ncbi:DUF5339 family protein [Taylorella asinigenitalis]|uniref:Lipoprotein n=1 Tax=Taylorella asinigenitalis (strain MCE3) TaxID=1008459 RepID=G4Q9I7_TAYAM|nr:DUF5339 family protein [Taylorella asinigenitalis]AEP36524.1 hypothetical protein TASI_0753 [Taylorella asinigenitalis MCE3]
MKKSLVLATLFSAVVLAACGDKEETKVSETTTTTTTTAPAETTAPATETTTTTTETTTTAADGKLPQECEDYFKNMNDYLAKLPSDPAIQQMKDSFKQAEEQTRASLKNYNDQGQMASACKQANDQFNQMKEQMKGMPGMPQ